MVKSNAMANGYGPVVERRADARRLLTIELAQTAIGVGLLVIVAFRGLFLPAAPAGSAMATVIVVELGLAVAAAVVLLALGFRARMGRELILADIARIEAARRSPNLDRQGASRGGEVVFLHDPQPYRSPHGCNVCHGADARLVARQ